MNARPAARRLCALGAALASIGGGDDEEEYPTYPRSDPDNPGGERVGQDDGDDGFTGYPADPGEEDDAYYDTAAESRMYSPNWTGAFVGAGLVGGPTFAGGEMLQEPATGAMGGLFVNFATLMQIVDLQLGFTRGTVNGRIDGSNVALRRDSLALSGMLHPGLIAIIARPSFGYPVSGFYLSNGSSLEWTRLEGGGLDARYMAVGWHLGAGLDFPIDSPQDGDALWVGVQWRWNHVPGDRDSEVLRRRTLREHMVLVRLSFRHNGNVITGFRGPDRP